MLERDYVRQQAARLDAAPALAPRTVAGQTEVVECLLRTCQDADHVSRVITELLDTVQRCQNLPAEIASIARASRRVGQIPPGCTRCETGRPGEWDYWVSSPRGATRCDCARGHWLAERSKTCERQERG